MKMMRYVALFSALLLFVCPERAATGGGASPAQITQSPQSADVLSPGAPIERELSSAETHSYRVALNSGDYLRVTVAQKGIDVTVKALGPDNKQVGKAGVCAGSIRKSRSEARSRSTKRRCDFTER